MKLLVIAASGGLGQKLVLEALSRGHAVSVLVRSSAKLESALGAPTVARLAAVHVGDASDKAALASAASGQDALISAASPDPAVARAVGEVGKASATVKRVVWTAGSSNILEPDGKTLHHTSFGERGLSFFNAHAPSIAALRATGATAVFWCPGLMRAAGHKSAAPVAISTRSIPAGAKTWDFVSYEDAADAILRAVESGAYDGEHITAISSAPAEL